MTLQTRPLHAVDLAHALGAPLSFEWVVAHAGDGTIADVWRARPEDTIVETRLDVSLMLSILQWLDPRGRFLTACYEALAEAIPEAVDDYGLRHGLGARALTAREAYDVLCDQPGSTTARRKLVGQLVMLPPYHDDARRVRRAIAAAVPAPSLDELHAVILEGTK